MEYTAKWLRPLGGEAISTATLKVCVCVCVCVYVCVCNSFGVRTGEMKLSSQSCFFIYLFLSVLGLRCCMGFSPVAASRGYSLVAVCRLLTAVVLLVAEHRL